MVNVLKHEVGKYPPVTLFQRFSVGGGHFHNSYHAVVNNCLLKTNTTPPHQPKKRVLRLVVEKTGG
ncbi:hypothetical protein ACVGXN_10540, partial [Enterobacter hormaechei]